MAMAKSAVIVFSIIALFGAAMAASYDVGDTAGWTTKDMPDYKKWADDKDFKVGDTLGMFTQKSSYMRNLQKIFNQNYHILHI